MKYINHILTFLLSISICTAQQEFETHSDGIIYSDTTMKKLRHIVDSLNLEFKKCDLTKPFYSKYQAKAHFVSLRGNIEQAKKDMEAGMHFHKFIKKHPQADIDDGDKNLLVVKFKEIYDNEIEGVNFVGLDLGESYNYEVYIDDNPSIYDKKVKNTWVFNYSKESHTSNDYIEGFFFLSEFEKIALPKIYSDLVQYSECMIDTNFNITPKYKTLSRWWGDERVISKIDSFNAFVNEKINWSKYEDSSGIKSGLENIRWKLIDSLSTQSEFKKKFKEALEFAQKTGNSDDQFEDYVGRYISKRRQLELKCSREVEGMCSRSTFPRLHALEVAKLSAETLSWDVFLRAHLNILNDFFKRASDASEAQRQRETYIKELEELNIDVMKLLLGISLRVENPSTNHYYGSIARLGRAFSEAKNSKEIEEKMLAMISDKTLDDYNRILIYYLFLNYNHYIQDNVRKKENVEKLKKALAELPEYLSKRIKFE